MLQTYSADHPVLSAIAAQDREGFVAAEMAQREAAGLSSLGRVELFDNAHDESDCLKAQYAHTRCPFVYSHRCG